MKGQTNVRPEIVIQIDSFCRHVAMVINGSIDNKFPITIYHAAMQSSTESEPNDIFKISVMNM